MDRERGSMSKTPRTTPTDDELRAYWRAHGGRFHGPHIETGVMAERKLLPLLADLLVVTGHDDDGGVVLGTPREEMDNARDAAEAEAKHADAIASDLADAHARIAELEAERERLAKDAAVRITVLPDPVGYISTGTYFWLVRGKADPESIHGTGAISAHKTDRYANPVYMEPADAAFAAKEPRDA